MNRESKSQQQLNLATLRRIDPPTIDVLGNSAHVAVYKFDDASKSWHKRDVEGSLFVIKRSEPPNYRILVLNRLSTENLTEDVTSNLLVQLSGPYMIYRNHLGVTTGIWFYEENDKEKINNLLNSIIQEERMTQAQDNSSVATLTGLLTAIKEQAATAPPNSYYPDQPYTQPPYPPPSPYQQQPYPNPPPQQSYQNPPPQHYQPPPPSSQPYPSFQQPAPPPPGYAQLPQPQPFPPQPFPQPSPSQSQSFPPQSLPPPSQSQLPGDVIANLISSLQNLPPNLSQSNSLPNTYPGQPTNNPNYNPSNQNPNSPKAPPKAFAYDANSPFPKLLSPSNISAKSLLQQPPPNLALNPAIPLANTQSGLPAPGRASPAPLSQPPPPLSQPPPPTSLVQPSALNGSSGSERGSMGGSGGLGSSGERMNGSGGVPRLSKQQLRQALLNLVQDDRFLDLVYNEYASQQR